MESTLKISGVIVPMVTPVTTQGMIDIPATFRLVDHLVSQGAAPFILGTTGESASIPIEQKRILVGAMIEANAERTITFAGISFNSYETAIAEAKHYFDEGVDIFVAHPPCYYPLSDGQILSYFERLADAIPAPLILYNIPTVTHCSISLDLIKALSQHPNIVGIKDSERDENRLKKILDQWGGSSEFVYLVGWGAQMAFGLLNSSAGIVPSSGNLVPGLYGSLFRAARKGDAREAEQLQRLANQISRIYQEGRDLSQSLAALKVMLAELNLCNSHVLPPLTPLKQAEEQSIIQQMKKLNIFDKLDAISS